MPKTKSQRLIERIRRELGLVIPDDAWIQRTRAGRWQKDAGAGVWALIGGPRLGSSWTVTALLKSKLFILDGDEIYGD